MKLQNLINKLKLIRDEYNHPNAEVIIRLGDDADLGFITSINDVYASNEAMNNKELITADRIDVDGNVSRLFEVEVCVDSLESEVEGLSCEKCGISSREVSLISEADICYQCEKEESEAR